jgi:phage tail sheath gpL-like
MSIIIAGFSPNNRVPGAFGEVLYGTSGQNAASQPLALLLVGQAGSSGTLTPDTEARQVFSKTDVDAACAKGTELACMAYDVLDEPESSGIPLFIISPTTPSGTAGTATCLISGTWTTGGQMILRIDGFPVTVDIQATDTPTTVATALAALINGANQGRLPITGAQTSGAVALSSVTANARANQHIVFLDTRSAPSGFAATITGNVWLTLTAYVTTQYVVPVTANGFYYKCTTAGTTGAGQPTWPTTVGTTVSDGSAVWTCWGKIVATGATTGVQLGGGAGLESYTNLLSAIKNRQFDTISLAANDATSLAAWKTQLVNQAAPPPNLLQQAIFATNGTLTAAQSLSQTTVNNELFQQLWQLNGETHPSRVAAAFGALRTAAEQSDPDAAYNFKALNTVVAQSQSVDWPDPTSTLISALNTGVSAITNNGDGVARIARSITTKCLTGGAPDYSTLDTGQSRTPQFILKDLKFQWAPFAVQNPRVQQEPLPNEKRPPSGVAYPSLWGSIVKAKMIDYSNGILSGATATVAPIVINVVDPITTFDPVAKRIMLAQEVTVAPNNAQVGVSVRAA